jgi:hypothetical protein
MEAASERALRFFERALWALLGALGGVYLLVYLWIVYSRLRYPFELEWMEGGTVHHLQRILDGLPLYARPSLDFIAYGYTPLYCYLSAGLATWIGNGFTAPRLVSFAASLACFAFIYLLTRRRSDSRFFSYLAVCLFAAAFRVTGAWLDIARVDTLFLAFLLAAIYAFESPVPSVRSLLSPALFFLAFFTKQTALILALPLCAVAFVLRRGAERVLFAIVLGALLAVSTQLMNHWTDGWYGYYVFDLPHAHGVVAQFDVVFGLFWIRDLLGHASIALCICLIPFLEAISERAWNARLLLDLCAAGGLLAMSWLGRIQMGGYDNALLPVFAGLAIFFGVGLARASALLSTASAYRLGIAIAALLQFAALTYRPGLQVPTAADRRGTEELIERIAAAKGDVYLADHPWYKVLAGKPAQAQAQAVIDVLRAHDAERSAALQREFSDALASGRYELLICDIEGCANGVSVDDHYELSADKPTSVELVPVTGGANRKPTYLYRRRGPD